MAHCIAQSALAAPRTQKQMWQSKHENAVEAWCMRLCITYFWLQTPLNFWHLSIIMLKSKWRHLEALSDCKRDATALQRHEHTTSCHFEPDDLAGASDSYLRSLPCGVLFHCATSGLACRCRWCVADSNHHEYHYGLATVCKQRRSQWLAHLMNIITTKFHVQMVYSAVYSSTFLLSLLGKSGDVPILGWTNSCCCFYLQAYNRATPTSQKVSSCNTCEGYEMMIQKLCVVIEREMTSLYYSKSTVARMLSSCMYSQIWTKRKVALFLLSVKTLHLNRFCFPFAAHCPHFSLTHSTSKTYHFWCKRAFTSSAFSLTRLSLINNNIHKLRLPSYPDERMKTQLLQVPRMAAIPVSTSCKQLQQHQKCEVREKTLSGFKKEWIRILTDCGVGEPFWSVKWILEHVLRKHPNGGEVCLIKLS